MRKIILLFISMFILTGCTAEYELIYENEVFNEYLKVKTKKTENLIDEIDKYYIKDYLVDYKIDLGDMTEYEYISKYGKGYGKELINDSEVYGLRLGYNYDEKYNYLNSSIVYTLFRNFNIDDNFINASSINNIFEIYPYLSEIKISFKTDYNIVNSNADEIKDNILYWNINKDNYLDKKIFIEYSKKEKLIAEDGYLNSSIIKYILMGLIIIILITIPIIYEKIKKSNI